MPCILPKTASRDAISNQNEELRYLLQRCCAQMQRDYALKQLMDNEKKPGKKLASGCARHMTNEENLIELAKMDWVAAMKEVFKDPVWKDRRDACNKHAKRQAAEKIACAREAEKTRREAEKVQKEAEKEEERRRKESQRSRERDAKKRKQEAEKALKKTARLCKAAEAAAAKQKKVDALAKKRLGSGAAKCRTRATQTLQSDTEDDIHNVIDVPGVDLEPLPAKPRPKPRPYCSRIVPDPDVVDVEAAIGESEQLIGAADGAEQEGVIVPAFIAEVGEPGPSVEGVEVGRGVRRSSRRMGKVAK